jgi:hypothetical protein
MRFLVVFASLLCACAAEVEGVSSAPAPLPASPALPGDDAGPRWSNQLIPQQTGAFHVVLAAIPDGPLSDVFEAVIGLSNGPAADLLDLGPIVRFSTAGTLDVRNGSTYQADRTFSYQRGRTYQIRIEINLQVRRYDVAVEEDGARTTWIANGYAFQTEQANMSQLDNVSSLVMSPSGTLEEYGLEANPSR